MKSKLSNKDIQGLLTGLKNAEKEYPSDIIKSRRDIYIKQATAMAVLANAGDGGAGITGTGSSTSSSLTGVIPFTGKILQTILVVTIVAEAGVVAHLYRDQILEILDNMFPPRVEQVVTPEVDVIPPVTDATSIEASTVSPSVTVTLTVGTPLPTIVQNNDIGTDSTQSEQASATPAPKDNPGNHYGNTPKPDREKDNKDQKDNSSSDKDKESKK